MAALSRLMSQAAALAAASPETRARVEHIHLVRSEPNDAESPFADIYRLSPVDSVSRALAEAALIKRRTLPPIGAYDPSRQFFESGRLDQARSALIAESWTSTDDLELNLAYKTLFEACKDPYDFALLRSAQLLHERGMSTGHEADFDLLAKALFVKSGGQEAGEGARPLKSLCELKVAQTYVQTAVTRLGPTASLCLSKLAEELPLPPAGGSHIEVRTAARVILQTTSALTDNGKDDNHLVYNIRVGASGAAEPFRREGAQLKWDPLTGRWELTNETNAILRWLHPILDSYCVRIACVGPAGAKNATDMEQSLGSVRLASCSISCCQNVTAVGAYEELAINFWIPSKSRQTGAQAAAAQLLSACSPKELDQLAAINCAGDVFPHQYRLGTAMVEVARSVKGGTVCTVSVAQLNLRARALVGVPPRAEAPGEELSALGALYALLGDKLHARGSIEHLSASIPPLLDRKNAFIAEIAAAHNAMGFSALDSARLATALVTLRSPVQMAAMMSHVSNAQAAHIATRSFLFTSLPEGGAADFGPVTLMAWPTFFHRIWVAGGPPLGDGILADAPSMLLDSDGHLSPSVAMLLPAALEASKSGLPGNSSYLDVVEIAVLSDAELSRGWKRTMQARTLARRRLAAALRSGGPILDFWFAHNGGVQKKCGNAPLPDDADACSAVMIRVLASLSVRAAIRHLIVYSNDLADELARKFANGGVLSTDSGDVTVAVRNVSPIFAKFKVALVGVYAAETWALSRVEQTLVVLAPADGGQTSSFILHSPCVHPGHTFHRAASNSPESLLPACAYFDSDRSVAWFMAVIDPFLRGEAVPAPIDGSFACEFVDADGKPELVKRSRLVEVLSHWRSSLGGAKRAKLKKAFLAAVGRLGIDLAGPARAAVAPGAAAAAAGAGDFVGEYGHVCISADDLQRIVVALASTDTRLSLVQVRAVAAAEDGSREGLAAAELRHFLSGRDLVASLIDPRELPIAERAGEQRALSSQLASAALSLEGERGGLAKIVAAKAAARNSPQFPVGSGSFGER